MRQLGGENIKTWTICTKPAAVIHKDGSPQYDFFIKSHILAGKFDLNQTKSNKIKEYAWLTKKEIEKHVNKNYFEDTYFLLN